MGDINDQQDKIGKDIEQQKYDLYLYVKNTNAPEYQIQYYVPKVINGDTEYIQHLNKVENLFSSIHEQIQELKQNYENNPPLENAAKKDLELTFLQIMIDKKSNALQNLNADIKQLANRKFVD